MPEAINHRHSMSAALASGGLRACPICLALEKQKLQKELDDIRREISLAGFGPKKPITEAIKELRKEADAS
jgi:hypothetical protein